VTKARAVDTFADRPWLVTKDEVKIRRTVKMWLTSMARPWQNGSTKTMVYGVA